MTKWGYALLVSKFVQAENRVLSENDTSVAPYTSRKPDFARGRHKCKRPVLTGFCSRSTPIRLEVPCWRSTKIEARETQLKMTEARVGTTRIRLLPPPRALTLQTHPSQRSRLKAFEVGRFGLTDFLWVLEPKLAASTKKVYILFFLFYLSLPRSPQSHSAHARTRRASLREAYSPISDIQVRGSRFGFWTRRSIPESSLGLGGWSPPSA